MRQAKQKYEIARIENLKPHPQNANKANLAALEKSIEHIGFYGAIIAQKSTGHILAGNHRYQVAVKENAATIPVLWLEVDDTQALKILAADNRINRLGQDDELALSELLSAIDLQDSLDGTGYDQGDLDALLESLIGESQTSENPEGFKEFSGEIETDYCCPKCGYSWSGKPK
jgi:ParB-like chromosome segregation protein Spo0J